MELEEAGASPAVHLSYPVEPAFRKKFRSGKVKQAIGAILKEKLTGAVYHPDNTSTWTREIADAIKVKLKEMDLERYKFVVQVVIGEQRGEGVKMGCRCLWDPNTDNYAHDVFITESIFCVAAAFGVDRECCSEWIFFFCDRRSHPRAKDSLTLWSKISHASSAGKSRNAFQVQEYTYEQLGAATGNFSTVLGSGKNGPVYKAVLPGGVEAVVKVHRHPRNSQSDASDGLDSSVTTQDAEAGRGGPGKGLSEDGGSVMSEIDLLSTIHYKKLVNLVGFCTENGSYVLAFEYKSNGSLHSHLHDSNAKAKSLTWPRRQQIALDVAEGLYYLHDGADPAVVHTDIRSANVFLDENFNGFLANFGVHQGGDFLRLFHSSSSGRPGGPSKSSAVAGPSSTESTVCAGYLDPELFYTHKFTQVTDIYSFGILLMEIISGLNPCVPTISLRDMAWTYDIENPNHLLKLIDPRLARDFNSEEVKRMAKLAQNCLSKEPASRPTVKQVLDMLEPRGHGSRDPRVDGLFRHNVVAATSEHSSEEGSPDRNSPPQRSATPTGIKPTGTSRV
ncbi:hypothetical protein CBR_g21047 [Chara braunii]|uniref:Protein kinase domain-containing protein n=1 Tax=Chara braunii TaxID=69332 RepID=A0A388L0P1_CHABU|nr:hypothetical protein CBR_g21047 [Chara braunii]|eukprot:GBG75802.1 hypothetical protein CBR_g21047 [Chara braunii]